MPYHFQFGGLSILGRCACDSSQTVPKSRRELRLSYSSTLYRSIKRGDFPAPDKLSRLGRVQVDRRRRLTDWLVCSPAYGARRCQSSIQSARAVGCRQCGLSTVDHVWSRCCPFCGFFSQRRPLFRAGRISGNSYGGLSNGSYEQSKRGAWRRNQGCTNRGDRQKAVGCINPIRKKLSTLLAKRSISLFGAAFSRCHSKRARRASNRKTDPPKPGQPVAAGFRLWRQAARMALASLSAVTSPTHHLPSLTGWQRT